MSSVKSFASYASLAVVVAGLSGGAISLPSSGLAQSRPTAAAAPSNRCEIVFEGKTCQHLTSTGVYIDTLEGTSSSAANCLRRAKEFHEWCRSTTPIVARFINNNKIEAQEKFPK